MSLDSEINTIAQQFLCACPLNKISWHDIFNSLNWSAQVDLVEKTVNFQRNLHYPIKNTYQKAFLKYIINKLNEHDIEVCDDVYKIYGQLVAKPDDNESFCYRHYLLDNTYISVRENVSIISGGTTGLCTWQAGIALAEWCVANKHLIKDQKVFELGSGVGLTGIAILLMCEASEIYFTDAHDKVLENLIYNIDLNSGLEAGCNQKSKYENSIFCRHINSTKVEVLDLPWSLVTGDLNFDAKIILAADVVYDPSIFSDLINAIDLLLVQDDSLLVLASTERNMSTLESFIRLLEERFVVIESDAPTLKCFSFPRDEKVHIHFIKRKS